MSSLLGYVNNSLNTGAKTIVVPAEILEEASDEEKEEARRNTRSTARLIIQASVALILVVAHRARHLLVEPDEIPMFPLDPPQVCHRLAQLLGPFDLSLQPEQPRLADPDAVRS